MLVRLCLWLKFGHMLSFGVAGNGAFLEGGYQIKFCSVEFLEI